MGKHNGGTGMHARKVMLIVGAIAAMLVNARTLVCFGYLARRRLRISMTTSLYDARSFIGNAGMH
jgi:hypothetical protein